MLGILSDAFMNDTRRLSILIAFCASVVSAEGGWGQESVLEPIGRARISAVYDIDAAPPYAYALERENLRVLDIRDPTSVREVANLEFEGPRARSVLHGSRLYLAGFLTPLAVVDVSNPLAPRWVGEHPDVELTASIHLSDDRLFVVRKRVGGITLDVLEPHSGTEMPVRISSLAIDVDTGPGPEYGGLAFEAGRAFMLVRPAGGARNRILIIDLTGELLVQRQVLLPTGERYNDLEVRGDLVYLVTRNPDGLATFLISEAEEATLISHVSDPRLWYGADMLLRDDVLYVSTKGSATLAAYDVSDPRSPRLAGVFEPAGEGFGAPALGFSVAGNRLYLSGDAGPSAILDVSSPLEPRFVGKWDYHGGWAADVSLEGSVAVIHTRWDGVYVYDFGDPTQPRRLGFHGGAERQLNFARRGHSVLVAFDGVRAELVDISDPERPAVVGGFGLGSTVSASAITDTHAIVAYRSGGLEIVDREEPDRRRWVDTTHPITDITATSGRALIVDNEGSLGVLDLREPSSPSLTAPSGVSRGARVRSARLAVADDWRTAFVALGEPYSDDGSVWIGVFAIQPDSAPRILGELLIAQPDYAPEFPIVLSGDELILGLGTDVVRIDVTNPERPQIRGRHSLRMTMAIEGLAVMGSFLLVGAAEDGVLVFELPPTR